MLKREFEFTLWLAPETRDLQDWSNALFAAGADDCSPGIHCGEPYVSFHREANTFEEAIRSARHDVQVAGCQIVRCEIAAEELAGWPGN